MPCKAYSLILGRKHLAEICIYAYFCSRFSFSIRSKSFTPYEAHISPRSICPS